jgi:hypothetical protein
MYGPDGLLAFGRRIGFSVAEAATHNGAPGAGGAGQVDSLTASLITHTVREPLQLWNFGHVVDRVGGCGAAWSAAVHRGAPDGPIRAVQACGDRAAVAYAQHLDGTNVWVGAVFVAAAVLLGFFMVVSGWAVLKVSVKAIWTTVILLPTLWLGAIPGAPQRRAVEVVWQFFRHGIEVLVYIVYVSVIGLAVERIVSRPLPAELGGTNPFAHVLMMAGVSIVAFILLRYIRADLSGRPPGRGMLGSAAGVAVGMGMHAAIGTGGSAALHAGKGLWQRWRARNEQTPWERIDDAASNARQVHGDPQPGYNPVPNAADDGPDSGAGGAASAGGAPGGDTPAHGDGGVGGGAGGGRVGAASSAPAAVAPLNQLGARPGAANHARGRCDRAAGRFGSAGAPGTGLDGSPSADPGPGLAGERPASTPGPDAPMVAPITELADSGDTAPAPLPDPPPPPDDEPPPPDDDRPAPPAPTTVRPISES